MNSLIREGLSSVRTLCDLANFSRSSCSCVTALVCILFYAISSSTSGFALASDDHQSPHGRRDAPLRVSLVDSLFLTLVPETLVAKNPASGKFLKPARRGRNLYPNWANLLTEVVVQGGFQPGSSQSDAAGGMRVGVSFIQLVGGNIWRPIRDSALVHGWARLTAWKFGRNFGANANALQKTLEEKGITHTGTVRGLDVLHTPGSSTAKLLTGERGIISPRKHNNKLYAELVALKFNIAASQLGKTPVGFGELVFNQPGHPCHGLSLVTICSKTDTVMTLWRGHPQAEYDSLYSAISRINRAFVGALDTVSFEAGAKLVLKGAVNLNDVPFLLGSLTPLTRLIPTTDLTEDEEDSFDDGFESANGSPTVIRLQQNFPNPFNPSTTITFRLAEPAAVTLRIYDILGREVATLLDDEEMEEGAQSVEFFADGLCSGTYFYHIKARDTQDGKSESFATRRMILLR